jgi:tellurite resistance protein TehA-like permease
MDIRWIDRSLQVANPCTHLSLVGNFVGSLLATVLGLRELAIFFWAVGLAHYLVLFVTLYQRLPTAATVPKELHPVFFLFIAAPSIASVAWSKIVGRFDLVSRIAYFVALFLYASLVRAYPYLLLLLHASIPPSFNADHHRSIGPKP